MTMAYEHWRRESARFDRRHGVDTAGRIESSDLAIESPNQPFGVRYEPTPPRTFAALMRNLPADLGEYTFVDFGSGKGRVVLLASRYGFRRIVGVEYARDLHEAACRNLRSYRDERRVCSDIELLHIDAVDYAIPATPCVFYFFQPFSRDVMARVLGNIKASLGVRRRVYLMILLPHPSTLDLIAKLDFVAPVPLRSKPIDWAWLYERDFLLLSNEVSEIA